MAQKLSPVQPIPCWTGADVLGSVSLFHEGSRFGLNVGDGAGDRPTPPLGTGTAVFWPLSLRDAIGATPGAKTLRVFASKFLIRL